MKPKSLLSNELELMRAKQQRNFVKRKTQKISRILKVRGAKT